MSNSNIETILDDFKYDPKKWVEEFEAFLCGKYTDEDKDPMESLRKALYGE